MLPSVCFLALNVYPTLAGTVEARVGGAEVQQVFIAYYLAALGYRVSFVTRDHGQEDAKVIDGITVFKTFRADDGLPYLRFFYPRWTATWAALNRADADVYYQRCAGMETGLAAAYCKKYKKKLVFSAASDSDFQPSQHIIPTIRDRLLYRYGLQNADAIIAQTSIQRELLSRNFNLGATVIPNCWDSGSSIGDTVPEKEKYVLWVSTLRAWKRPGLFLDLASRFPSRRFVMVGGPASGEGALYCQMKQRAAQLGNVHFEGFVPFRDVDRWFDGANIFVNTSEPKEGFPNTLLQAWQRGIPVVSYFDPDGIIERQMIGRVVKNIEEAVDSLALLFKNANLRSRLGSAAKHYFDGHHKIRTVGQEYETLFRELSRGEK